MTPDKPLLLAAVRGALSTELAALERVAAQAVDEASNEETRSEGEYDTRATEASYLARGLAKRITALRQLVAWFGEFDPSKALASSGVQVGALVELDGDELLFMAPAGGGIVEAGGKKVKLISRSSPLGAALLGLEVGDAVEVDTPRGVVEREIVGVW